MNRRKLSRALARYSADGTRETASLARLRRFVAAPRDPFDRENPVGHVTGSAVVARPDGSKFLLLLHRRLLRWVQPGGHTEDEDASVYDAARREAIEETGIPRFSAPLGEEIFDVDVHPIPARGREPAHLHFDVRYLLTTRRDADPDASDDPARPIRWVSYEKAVSLGIDPSLKRALKKARKVLGGKR